MKGQIIQYLVESYGDIRYGANSIKGIVPIPNWVVAFGEVFFKHDLSNVLNNNFHSYTNTRFSIVILHFDSAYGVNGRIRASKDRRRRLVDLKRNANIKVIFPLLDRSRSTFEGCLIIEPNSPTEYVEFTGESKVKILEEDNEEKLGLIRDILYKEGLSTIGRHYRHENLYLENERFHDRIKRFTSSIID